MKSSTNICQYCGGQVAHWTGEPPAKCEYCGAPGPKAFVKES